MNPYKVKNHVTLVPAFAGINCGGSPDAVLARAGTAKSLLDSRFRDCVVIGECAINIVIPAKAGIQDLLIILDSVSRFACTE
jgi:hypothetical protein